MGGTSNVPPAYRQPTSPHASANSEAGTSAVPPSVMPATELTFTALCGGMNPVESSRPDCIPPEALGARWTNSGSGLLELK